MTMRRKPWEPVSWKFRYDSLLELIIEHPGWRDEQFASSIGYSRSWLNKVKNSAILQERLDCLWKERMERVIQKVAEAETCPKRYKR